MRSINEGRARGDEHLFDLVPNVSASTTGCQADVIISFHMLDHVPDLRSYLLAVGSVLKPGGFAMFRVPNGGYLRAWLHGFRTWGWFAYPDHLHMLSPASVSCLIADCGFELVDLTSNACGESFESIAAWLPETLAAGPEAVTALEQAGCLMELEFVMCKPSDTVTVEISSCRTAAATFAARSAQNETAIQASPSEFAIRVLARLLKR